MSCESGVDISELFAHVGVVFQPQRLEDVTLGTQETEQTPVRAVFQDDIQLAPLRDSPQKIDDILVFSNMDEDFQLGSQIFVFRLCAIV